jgi:hypothetical protein
MRLSFEGDVVEAQRLLGIAQQELERLAARLETTGLDSGKFLLGFPGTSNYCYGHILPGGLRQLHIVTTPGVTTPTSVEIEDPALPDFLSGWAIDGRYETDPETGRSAVRDFRPTAACAQLHSEEVHVGANRVERLAIEPGPGFSGYFDDRGPLPRSQVDCLYPSAYSGRMKRWVQIMLGFGKKPTQTSVYDDVEPEIEAPDPPEELTAWQQTLLDEGMRVWYDFRFHRTHGIHTAADGKSWLVEISMNRGVVAMPLPIDERTTTPEFYEKLQNIGDQAGMDVIDEFGGFPSGEPFPSTAAMWDAYVRAGRIVELAPPSRVSDFYSHLQYSSAMGWAFNERGDEAHNTAYRYGDDGVQVGVHYATQLSIGATQEIDPPDEAAELKTELDGLRVSRASTFEAVMWKIDRLEEGVLESYLLRLNSEPAADIYDEIDALELAPLASGTCTVTKAGEGKLWWPTRFQPQIKFFEPQLGYLLSHDLRPDRADAPRDPECDTTVHVFFAGNELKWAKYFHDPRRVAGGWSGDDEFVSLHTPVGTFKRYFTRGSTGVASQYYTNDIDVRQEFGDSVDEYTYRGYDRGYPQYIFEVDHFAEPPANFGAGDRYWSRNKLFRKEFDSRFDLQRESVAAVAVPAWHREAMVVATVVGEYMRDGVDTWYWQGVVDPNYGLEYVGDGDALVDQLAYSHFDEVDAIYAITKPFADEGPWCSIGDEVVFSGSMPPSNQGGSTFIPGYRTRTLTVTLISASAHSPQVVRTETREGDAASLWNVKWFVPSPHPDFGDTQYYHSTQNCAGESECLVYLEDVDGAKNVTVGTPQDSAFESRLPIFVGVV